MGRQNNNNNNIIDNNNIISSSGINIINKDPSMVNSSSIALLQERFRQLEKVKERREGKELLKLFSSDHHIQRSSISSSSSSATIMHFQASSSDYSSDLQSRFVLPHNHKPNLLQYDSLSLDLHMANKQHHGDDDDDDYSTVKSPSNSGLLWPENASSSSSMSRNFEHSDVDTSLHL